VDDGLATVADEVVCLQAPPFFSAVGQWYERFDQTDDDEVRELLARCRPLVSASASRT
jgi:putative phosphoribosyl transferase